MSIPPGSLFEIKPGILRFPKILAAFLLFLSLELSCTATVLFLHYRIVGLTTSLHANEKTEKQVSGAIIVLSSMQEMSRPPMSLAKLSLTRGDLIQLRSVFLTISQSREIRSSSLDFGVVQTLLGIFASEESRISMMFKGPVPTRLSPVSPVVGSRLVILSTNLIRDLNAHMKSLSKHRSSLTRIQNVFLTVMASVLLFFLCFLGYVSRTEHRMIEVLSLELNLTGRLIITENTIDDWRAHVRKILRDINEILETNFLVALFMTGEKGEESFHGEVFWQANPAPETVSRMETFLSEYINGKEEFHAFSFEGWTHSVVDASRNLSVLDIGQIRCCSQSLFLKQPKIGGIIGVILHSRWASHPLYSLALESLLSSILNVLGSIRAIYLHTKEIEFYALRDPLTGLYNQRLFWELFEYEVDRCRRHGRDCSVMICDLDDFKQINDTCGHSEGDRYLKKVGDVLKQYCRSSDIVCRYGGDEFSVILPETGIDGAFEIAQRIRSALADPDLLRKENFPLRSTVSIGVASFPLHGEISRDLFLLADHLMYQSKKEGKNAVVQPSFGQMADVFKSIGEQKVKVIQALEDDRIVPYFQPIRNLTTGEVIGYEILCRLLLPGDTPSVMVAADFIEIIEEKGLIGKMDEKVIEKAFTEVRATGFTGMIFVNLSPKSLIMPNFITIINELSRQIGIFPSQVVFEITERETVRNISILEIFMKKLKENGYLFAIDDFGAGYSSLSYLRRFPINFLKIDGEFIRGMGNGSRVDQAIVHSILSLASVLEIPVVAENVENESIRLMLADFGVLLGQGYHLGHPSRGLER